MTVPRSLEPEILDAAVLDDDELGASLRHVAQVNRWLGGTRALRSHLYPLVRTGGAYTPSGRRHGKRRDPGGDRRVGAEVADAHVSWVGVDLSAQMVALADPGEGGSVLAGGRTPASVRRQRIRCGHVHLDVAPLRRRRGGGSGEGDGTRVASPGPGQRPGAQRGEQGRCPPSGPHLVARQPDHPTRRPALRAPVVHRRRAPRGGPPGGSPPCRRATPLPMASRSEGRP